MERVVGNIDCKFIDVCNAIHESPCVGILYKKWKVFARHLSVPDLCINELESRNHGYPCFSTIYDVLVAWRGKKSRDATLFELITALKNCGLKDAADALGSQLPTSTSSQPIPNRFCRGPSGFLQFVNSTQAVAVICTPLPEVTYSRLLETTSASITISKLIKDKDYILSEMKSVVKKSIAIVSTENTSSFLQIWKKSSPKLVLLTQEIKADLKRKLRMKQDLKILSDNMKWSDLTLSYQNELLKNSDLLQRVDEQFLEMNIDDALLFSLIGNPASKTFMDHLPIPVSYYIPRRLSSKHVISLSLFKKPTTKDIYLFSGMTEKEFGTLTGISNFETSSKLLLNFKNMGSYILLDVETHFEKLSTLTEKTLHWFEGQKLQEEWKMIWKTSVGPMDRIRQYIECCEYNEDQFLDLVETSRKPICIIAESRIDFVGVIKSRQKNNTFNVRTIGEIICSVVPCNQVDKLIMQRLVESESDPIELFFEDVDEISNEDTDILYNYFQYINNCCTSIRLWFTSNHHLSKKIEDKLNFSAYELLPFNASEQHRFFISFWQNENENAVVRKLGTFANELGQLKNVKTRTTSENDREKSEFIPLYCFLIATIYQDDAIKYASSQYKFPMPQILNEPVAFLYEKMVEINFKKFTDKGNVSTTDLYNLHIRKSFQLLFPHWMHRLNKYLPYNQSFDDNEIINASILKSVGSNSVPKFIHKTFAEYFISKFITNRFKNNCSETVVEFFLTEILKNRTSKVPIVYYGKWHIRGLTAAVFERNFMCYLVVKYAQKNHPKEIDITGSVVLRIDTAKQLALACAFHNNFSLFKVLKAINVFATLQPYVYNQHMLYVLARFGDLSFLEFVLNAFLCLTEIRAQQVIGLAEIKKFRIKIFLNLLRIAASRGHYDIFNHLFRQEEFIKWFEAPNKTLIIHACVQNSLSDSRDVIFNKIRIIAELHKVKNNIVEEKDKEGRTAILCSNVHDELLIKLIQLNSILRDDYEMLLHNALWYLTQDKYHFLVKNIPKENLQTLLTKKNSSGQTLLQVVVSFTNPDVKLLRLFNGMDADFNNVDKHDDCILSVAIKNGTFTNLDVLVECGARLDRVNKNGDSLLHIASASSNTYALAYLLNEKESNGKLEEINKVNNNLETPLHVAVLSQKHQAPQVVSYLIRKNADMSARNIWGDNALECAFQKGILQTVQILFAEYYSTVICDTTFATEIIYFAAKFSSLDTLKFVCDQFYKVTPDLALADIKLGQDKISFLHAAVSNKHCKEIATYFLELHGFKTVLDRPYIQTVIPDLLKCGVDVPLDQRPKVP